MLVAPGLSGDEHVPGFDVAVDEVALMGRAELVRGLAQQRKRPLGLQRPLLLEQRGELGAADVAHGDVELPPRTRQRARSERCGRDRSKRRPVTRGGNACASVRREPDRARSASTPPDGQERCHGPGRRHPSPRARPAPPVDTPRSPSRYAGQPHPAWGETRAGGVSKQAGCQVDGTLLQSQEGRYQASLVRIGSSLPEVRSRGAYTKGEAL